MCFTQIESQFYSSSRAQFGALSLDTDALRHISCCALTFPCLGDDVLRAQGLRVHQAGRGRRGDLRAPLRDPGDRERAILSR